MPTAMPRPTLPQLGEVLAGKYRIVRKLGEGGMGVVFEAMHTRIEQRVAIKMLLPEVLDVPDVVSRFEREARAAGKLRSENTTRVLDVDVSEVGLPYMVMEFLDGSDLGQILEQGGALPISDAVDFVLQACNAMAEAHSVGVIHRDLKPSNLFVTLTNGLRRVKVLDFGISKLENDKEARVTATQTVVGTPLYMSPEQVRSAKHVDARSDIWSLGIILYELLAGRTPFEGSTTAAAAAICIDAPPPLSTYRQGVPPALEHALLGALQKEPAARFPNVQSLASAIAPFGSGAIRMPDTLPAPIRAPQPSHSSLPGIPRSDIESARTLNSDPSMPSFAPRAAAGGTLPGWTTRSSPGARRAWWVVAAAIGALAALLIAGVVIGRWVHRTADDTHVRIDMTATPPVTVTPSGALTPSGVSSTEAVPSAAVVQTPSTDLVKPGTAATTHGGPVRPQHGAPTTTVTTPTATHTAAPLPTRL